MRHFPTAICDGCFAARISSATSCEWDVRMPERLNDLDIFELPWEGLDWMPKRGRKFTAPEILRIGSGVCENDEVSTQPVSCDIVTVQKHVYNLSSPPRFPEATQKVAGFSAKTSRARWVHPVGWVLGLGLGWFWGG